MAVWAMRAIAFNPSPGRIQIHASFDLGMQAARAIFCQVNLFCPPTKTLFALPRMCTRKPFIPKGSLRRLLTHAYVGYIEKSCNVTEASHFTSYGPKFPPGSHPAFRGCFCDRLW